MKQTDKDYLLIRRCRNDEQRIKMLEFFRFAESSAIQYESLKVQVADLRIKPETVEKYNMQALAGLTIDFDIYLPGRKLVMNLFSSSMFASLANKTEAAIRYSVKRMLDEHVEQMAERPAGEWLNDVAEVLVVAVRQHFIALNIVFPSVLDIRLESPWFWGHDIEIWLLRGSNFDNLCSALLI